MIKNSEYKKYFTDVVYIVNADSYTKHQLWSDYSLESAQMNLNGSDSNLHLRRSEDKKRIDWKDQAQGWMVTIGHLDNRPINLSINYSFLNNKKVMFYDPCSQLVDYKMIDEWFELYAFDLNGEEIKVCTDASNFHYVLRHVK